MLNVPPTLFVPRLEKLNDWAYFPKAFGEVSFGKGGRSTLSADAATANLKSLQTGFGLDTGFASIGVARARRT